MSEQQQQGHGRSIAVIGLGYVGLPVAVAFGISERIIGFDINPRRIDELKSGIDSTDEVAPEELRAAHVTYTCDLDALRSADFFIVAVPTPVDDANQPDLRPLVSASATVGKVLKPGDIVVYESTVYPGATEEECVPVLERESGLKFGVDFKVGYSPERIVPGDKEHTFRKIRKIVSGCDAESCDVIAKVYESVVDAGVHRASSIKVAEAAKVIENTQRDLNIALMNELAVVFKRMGIDTLEVLEAAGSKWNFLPFRPGLVGGHCIGVDPYYLTHKAERLGYIPQVILAGRRINDNMSRWVARETVKLLVQRKVEFGRATVAVLGLTFKENCPDIRNSKVFDILKELDDYGIRTIAVDPVADLGEVQHEYGVQAQSELTEPVDALIVAVAHKQYRELPPDAVRAYLKDGAQIVVDVKSIFDRAALEARGLQVWRL
jgi:UDP-N-acetyl-D-galactosamine dehydrogenase